MVAKNRVLRPRPARFNEPVRLLKARNPDHNPYRRVQHKIRSLARHVDGTRVFTRADRLAVAHHTDADAKIILPVNRVTATQLLKVLRALGAARGSPDFGGRTLAN
jgi:hypothetical protein